MAKRKITRVYTRLYSDTGQLRAYVEWSDGSRIEGDAYFYHGVAIPETAHMGALFDRALAEGLTVKREEW